MPFVRHIESADLRRWAGAVLAAGVAVFICIWMMNTLVRSGGAGGEARLWPLSNALIATLQFYACAPFMAAFLYFRRWRKLETMILAGAAVYLPIVLIFAAAAAVAVPPEMGTRPAVAETFLRIVKNVPAVFSSVTVFWWFAVGRQSAQPASPRDANPHIFPRPKGTVDQEVAQAVRDEAMEQTWAWTIVSINIASGVIVILLAAGLPDEALYGYCFSVIAFAGLALLHRAFFLKANRHGPAFERRLAVFDGLVAFGWGTLPWFLMRVGETDETALVLPCLLAGALVMSILAARRLYPPVLSIVALFLPFITAEVMVRHETWLLLTTAATVAGIVSFGLAETLRRQSVHQIELRVRLQHANEELAQAAVQAERDYAMRERLLRSIGHDLRQPISALNFFLHRLGSNQDPSRQQAALEQSRACIRSANDVIESLSQLAWATGQVSLKPFESVALEPLFHQLFNEFKEEAQAKGLAFRYRLGATHVHSDRLALERILRNLLSNAVRVTTSGGVLLASRRRNGRVELLVFDTGPGLAQEDLEAVFQEFFQAGGESNPRSGFLGVGLFIVKQLTDGLGAERVARSEPGRGSVFGVRLSPEP